MYMYLQVHIWSAYLQHTMTHCTNTTKPQNPTSKLQIFSRDHDTTATHCNTLQYTATRCNTLQHTATQCNTMRHTATHFDTLQHPATHRNSHIHI